MGDYLTMWKIRKISDGLDSPRCGPRGARFAKYPRRYLSRKGSLILVYLSVSLSCLSLVDVVLSYAFLVYLIPSYPCPGRVIFLCHNAESFGIGMGIPVPSFRCNLRLLD